MKQVSLTDASYKALYNDAKRRKLSIDELLEIIIKREYKLK
jgi:hypothetical protein